MDSLPWFINRLANLIGDPQVTTRLPHGAWVRAVPAPYYPGPIERLRAAWWIITGRAHAVIWPEPGDLEHAMDRYSNRAALDPRTDTDRG